MLPETGNGFPPCLVDTAAFHYALNAIQPDVMLEIEMKL